MKTVENPERSGDDVGEGRVAHGQQAVDAADAPAVGVVEGHRVEGHARALDADRAVVGHAVLDDGVADVALADSVDELDAVPRVAPRHALAESGHLAIEFEAGGEVDFDVTFC